jgi:hypothetical protein
MLLGVAIDLATRLRPPRMHSLTCSRPTTSMTVFLVKYYLVLIDAAIASLLPPPSSFLPPHPPPFSPYLISRLVLPCTVGRWVSIECEHNRQSTARQKFIYDLTRGFLVVWETLGT